MKTSLWLSEQFGRLSRRERRVVAAGAALSALALITAYSIVPFARGWTERSAALEAKAEQVARLEALVNSDTAFQAAVSELLAKRNQRGRRLLTGSTPVLAASVLQTLLRSYAEQSMVTIQRIDIARDFEPGEDGLTPIGLQLSARGDIYGLVDLLYLVQHGEKLLVVDDLRVNATAARRRSAPALIGWTIYLHGFYVPEEEAA